MSDSILVPVRKVTEYGRTHTDYVKMPRTAYQKIVRNFRLYPVYALYKENAWRTYDGAGRLLAVRPARPTAKQLRDDTRRYYASRRIANEAAKQFLANSIATYGKSI